MVATMIGRLFQIIFLACVLCAVLFALAMYVGDRLAKARRRDTRPVERGPR
jgi:hypothetical protein